MEYSMIKVWYERGGGAEPEIRRFSVPKDVDSTYNYINDKVSEVFAELKHGNFRMYWKDNEDDLVMFSSQEELDEALSSVTDSVLRLVIKETRTCDKAGRVTSHGRPGRRHGVRWTVTAGLENAMNETIPPRLNRGMRKSRGRLQQVQPDRRETTPGRKPACMPELAPEDNTHGISDKWRQSFFRHLLMRQQDGLGQHRPRRSWKEACCDNDQTAVLSDGANKEPLSGDVKQPSLRPNVLSWEERVNRRKLRRQRMLQELQGKAQPDDRHVGFYPRWRSMRAAGINNMEFVNPDQGYGLNAGCRGFRAVRGADRPEGCVKYPARRGEWRRKANGRHHWSGQDESFASCQRRRLRRLKHLRREAMMREFELAERFGRNQLHRRQNGQRRCENTEPSKGEEPATTGTNWNGRMRRTAYLSHQDQCPTMHAAKFEKLKSCRETGEFNFQVRNQRIPFQSGPKSDLAAYRLRVLRRLRRQRLTTDRCHKPVQGLRGCGIRRGVFPVFRQSANHTRHGKLLYWPGRLRRGSRKAFGCNMRNIRWKHLIRRWNRRANRHSIYTRRSSWKAICIRPIRHAYRQKISHPVRQHFHIKFIKSAPQTPTHQMVWRNAVKAHLVKTFLKKQKRLMDFGRPHCGRPTPWRSGYRHRLYRPLNIGQVY